MEKNSLTVTIHMDSDVTKLINDRLDKMQEEIEHLKKIIQMAVNNFVPRENIQ